VIAILDVQNVWRSVALPVGGADQRRQPVPPGFLYHYVQRFGMVSDSSYNRHIILLRSNISFLRSDYLNPIELCNRLNTYIVPEAAVHAFLTFLFVINGYWLAIILNLPLLAYNGKKYVVTLSLG
jgi:Cornichon protein